ncbi:MAG TPA: DUF5666 domain-containing protein [Candidatus Acidoferrum sp.]|nr:DUF5666 domain-containing protein [Candidatus Acidoferrum sp.]
MSIVMRVCVGALVASLCIFVDVLGATPMPAQAAQQSSAQNAAARPVGTIKSISGNTITLTTDAGTEVGILVQDGTRLVRVAPGQKDLKEAAPIHLQDLQVGDRLLIRGNLAEDGKSVLAASIIAMKKTDIAEKQAREREEWQRHGVGGLVNGVDPATGSITIATNALGPNKDVVIHISKETILRRYAPDSVKFDDAKPAPLSEIIAGDQLRARGIRSVDGNELTADEIVSGSFRNIAGPITAIDPGTSTISVQDLLSKKSIAVKITADSQLRKLPPPMAQRIAMRLKGAPLDPALNSPAPAAGTPRPGDTSGGAGPGGGRPSGGGDLQQAISRMPPASLADLQKGDAVMIVATQGTQEAKITVITLLGGVEAILEASPKGGPSTILSPWSLSGAPGGDAGGPQ